MHPNEFDPLPREAALLGPHEEIEVQVVGKMLFLSEQSYDQDTDFERRHVSMSMRCAYELLSWLYEHETAIRQRAHLESL